MPILETKIPITLDEERFMIFNANTMCAFEEATGKFFLDTVAKLYDAMRPVFEKMKTDRRETDIQTDGMSVVRVVPMTDLRALIWAAVHEYNAKDEPVWPLTITQVGRYITITNIPTIFSTFLKGQTKNSPTREEVGESQAPTKKAPNGKAQSDLGVGGERSIELPKDAFV